MTDFIQQFDKKIQQLNELRGRIDSTINMRREFTENLKERLNGIGQRIRVLYDLIGELKKNKDNFERQLNDNNTNMQNNTDEINIYKQTINTLKLEKQNMAQRLKEQEQAIKEKINQKQNIVEANELELRDLRQANESQQTEILALREQINNKGTQKDREHAEALERLNEQNTKQLAEQEAQLLARISDLGNQITALNEELSSTKEQLTNSQNSLQQQINENQAQITQLTDENTQLRSENQRLQEKVQAATQAIQTAIEDLTNLMNEVPNAQTQQEIEPILKSIMDTIEGSITMINNNNNNNNTQGQAPGPEPAPAPAPEPAPGQESQNAVIIRAYPQRLQDDQLTTNNIPLVLDNLRQFSDVVTPEEKNKIDQTIRVLQNSEDKITNEQIKKIYHKAFQKGGKKTRKNRKNRKRKTKKMKKNKKHQKGGFIYNPNTKRKKLSSSKNATRSRSSTRKRTYSSKTSRQSSKSSKSSF